MKKWIRRILYSLLVVAVLVVAAVLGLTYVSGTPWFQTRVTEAVQQALGREITLTRLGASLNGIWLANLRIAEAGGFDRGVFAHVGRLRVRLSLLPLLKGNIHVQAVIVADAQVNLITQADGTTNIDDWLTPQPQDTPPAETETATPPLRMTVERVRLENVFLTYIDQAQAHTWELKNLNADVHHFNLAAPFPVYVRTYVSQTTPAGTVQLPLGISAEVDLKDLEVEHATATVHTAQTSYQGATAVLTGKVTNFARPYVDATLRINKLSSKTVQPWVQMPAFELPELLVKTKLTANPAQQTLVLHHASVQALGLTVTGQGGINYATKPNYQFTATLDGTLEELGRWFYMLATPYRLMGTVHAQATATPEKFTAEVALTDVGGLVEQAGQFANINGQLSAWETADFKTGALKANLTGKFNAHPLTLAAAVTQNPQRIAADLDLSAQELVWRVTARQQQAEQPTPLGKTATNTWPFPPVDLQANVQVEKLDVPYFCGTQVAFTSSLKHITPDLKQAQGVLHLTTQDGKIQDLYKLTNANPLTKVLFMSLNVTGRVFNSLNVFGVLKSIGGGIGSVLTGTPKETAQTYTQTVLGPDGQPLEVTVEATPQTVDGTLEYDTFDTQVDFVHGKATVKDGSFVSTTMSLRLNGTTDFNTGVVDLTVQAAPGRHEVDGIMPLTLKIGGTLEEPTGNMQLLGSVASLVTQTVTNNVVSRNVTKGVKGLFGLFKKKEEPQEE